MLVSSLIDVAGWLVFTFRSSIVNARYFTLVTGVRTERIAEGGRGANLEHAVEGARRIGIVPIVIPDQTPSE